MNMQDRFCHRSGSVNCRFGTAGCRSEPAGCWNKPNRYRLKTVDCRLKSISGRLMSITRKYGVFYVIGLIAAFALKLYYSRASVDDLDWVLAPTAWWVRLLSGIPFEREPGVGYISHEYRFVIAPVCAGINFMIIALATLIFSFIHRLPALKSRLVWLASCFLVIYPYTILVNSLRIIPSIYLLQMDFYGGWITRERVHTMEGVLVYFAALLFLYRAADKASTWYHRRSPAGLHETGSSGTGPSKAEPPREAPLVKPANYAVLKWVLPVFFYFSITLGIPFLNGAYRTDPAKFLEFTALVAGVCFMVLVAVTTITTLRRLFFQRKL